MANSFRVHLFEILSMKLNSQLIMREWYYMDEEAGIEL